MRETLLTLWIIKASNRKWVEITHVYASDEQQARERAKNWIEAHPHLPEVQFKECPDGFQFVRRWLPGKITFH